MARAEKAVSVLDNRDQFTVFLDILTSLGGSFTPYYDNSPKKTHAGSEVERPLVMAKGYKRDIHGCLRKVQK